MTASHAAQMKPAFAKKAVTVWQDASPQNPKAVHFLNMPGIGCLIFMFFYYLQFSSLLEFFVNNLFLKNIINKFLIIFVYQKSLIRTFYIIF